MTEDEHRKLWTCLDCKRYIKFTCECPMLHDALWLSIASQKDFLCFDCVEVRLGREMTLDDMKLEPPVNYVLVTLLRRARHSWQSKK